MFNKGDLVRIKSSGEIGEVRTTFKHMYMVVYGEGGRNTWSFCENELELAFSK